MIGSTISHYRIIEKLGEGGMGVVYKAQDIKLDRFVALKFLPHEIIVSNEDKARFLQEARAASAVMHPNVCVIHDIAEYENQQFIVMEFVDGKTLRQIIPLQKMLDAITYAIQIGEALQEAHNKGVVHRDIKTDNIMVNTKNQIKVMDFGLAKLKGTMKLTKTSLTAGTLAYMAPEQLKGSEVDARSDIFSFGVVLFEMLTGKLPFHGEFEAAMMYSIVNEEPESIQKYRTDLSSEFLHIMNRALEKDPEDRYQTIHDMLIDLQRVKKETSRDIRVPIIQPTTEEKREVVPEGQGTSATIKRKKTKRTYILAGILSILLLVAAIIFFIVLSSPAPMLNPEMSFRALPIPFNEVGTVGLSKDGNWAAFPAYDANNKYDVYYTNTTSGESRRITSDSSTWMNNADISPDGSQIVYDRYNYSTRQMEIAIVSSNGGSSKKIVDAGVIPRWRPDGQRIGYVRGKDQKSQSGKAEFWSVKPNGSDNRRELVDSVSNRPTMFAWSPDGQSICWKRVFSEQWREIFIYELSAGKERQVTFDKKMIFDVCWASNDQIIYASDRNGNWNLWMVPASGGSATQITKGAGPDYGVDISRDGSKLLCQQQQEVSHIWIAGTDGSNPHQITYDDVFLWRVAFSPDGKEIVFALDRPLGFKGNVVCSIDRDGKNRKELTSSEEWIGNPLPSPDGRWIIYGGYPLGEPQDSMKMYLVDAKNPGSSKLICKGCPMRWVDEKTFISFRFRDSSDCYWINSIEGGATRKFFEDSTYAYPLQGGKYIGYYDRRLGRRGLWICAAPGVKDPTLSSPKKLIGETILNVELDKSGKFAYYVKNVGELRRISIPSGKEEIIRGIFPGLNPDFEHSTFNISYDGKEIVYTDQRYNSKLVIIENPFK